MTVVCRSCHSCPRSNLKMKCHYEVLDVARDADLAEIKAAYKKLALKWHPDKNLDNPEDAKEQFQLIQQAYEVLSDRQERAWYDNHREQILRGSDSGFEDNTLDVYQYFTSTCFKGYGDDDSGFYAVYRKVFESIAKEDMEFMENKEDFCSIPMFGESTSDYEPVVKQFYDYWSAYSTRKSYTWLDPYNIKEARDRRTIKVIEKENKKVRQKAKKERNEEVRALVAFVRKRDRRVQNQAKLQEAKKLENRQKQEKLKIQKKLERKEELSKSAVEEWAKFDNLKSELIEMEKKLAAEFSEELSNSESENEEFEDDSLYCVACNKLFKTPKTFKNHESSKKHKENVLALKDTLLQDEFEEKLSEGDLSENEESVCSDFGNSKKSKKKKKKAKARKIADEDDSFSESCDEIKNGENSESFEESNDNNLDDKNNENPQELPSESRTSDNNSDVEPSETKKNKKSQNLQKIYPSNNHELEDSETEVLNFIEAAKKENDNFEFSSEKQKKKNTKKKATKTPQPNQENNIAQSNSKIKAAKSKKSKEKQIVVDVSEIDTNHCCAACNTEFPSKNKLFEHLKKTGHSVYLPQNVNSKQKKQKRNVREQL